MAKTITVGLDLATQEVDIDLVGFHGEGCADISKALSQAIGEVKTTRTKPEFKNKTCSTVSK